MRNRRGASGKGRHSHQWRRALEACARLSARTQWTWKRNVTIWAVYRTGVFSQRFLAEVFDLSRSHVASIIAHVNDQAAQNWPPRLSWRSVPGSGPGPRDGQGE